HVDQYSGDIVGRAEWRQYGLMAKVMAAGVPLHMGQLGWWNRIAACLVCLSVITLSASGLAAWWWRRPAREWRLAAPPAPKAVHVPPVVWAVGFALCVLFPLAGIALAAVVGLDLVLFSRIPRLRRRL